MIGIHNYNMKQTLINRFILKKKRFGYIYPKIWKYVYIYTIYTRNFKENISNRTMQFVKMEIHSNPSQRKYACKILACRAAGDSFFERSHLRIF